MNLNTFDYTDFMNNMHYLDSLAIEEDCGKYYLHLRSYDFIRFDRVYTNTPHNHDFYELCLVLNGSGLYTYGGNTYKIKSGDLMIAEPNVMHEISSYKTKDLYIVFLLFNINEIDIPVTSKNEDIILSNFVKSHKIIANDTNLLFHYLPLLLIDMDNKNKGRELSKIITTKAWFFDCLSILSVNSVDSHVNEKNNKNLDMAVAYITNNITTNIKVGDIAKHAFVSERHLRHLFKKYYGLTISEFIQKKKIVLAENKLRMGFKINEAAESVGIYNASQFCKIFKKQNGVTPKFYSDLFKQVK
jgi:AraC-like DNA-binding protein